MSERGPHLCTVEGCGVEIERRDFLCSAHWERVPQRLHEELTRAWRAYEDAGEGDALKLAGHAYRRARERCRLAASHKTFGARILAARSVDDLAELARDLGHQNPEAWAQSRAYILPANGEENEH